LQATSGQRPSVHLNQKTIDLENPLDINGHREKCLLICRRGKRFARCDEQWYTCRVACAATAATAAATAAATPTTDEYALLTTEATRAAEIFTPLTPLAGSHLEPELNLVIVCNTPFMLRHRPDGTFRAFWALLTTYTAIALWTGWALNSAYTNFTTQTTWTFWPAFTLRTHRTYD
jgi:hypothetical protein